MKRVLPSTIVDFIDHAMPQLRANSGNLTIPLDWIPQLRVVLRLLDDLAAEFWPTGQQLLDFLTAWETIRDYLVDMAAHGRTRNLPARKERSPLWVIYEAMRDAPAVAVPESVAGLEFIGDVKYRQQLREDIASAETLLTDGQYKACTVLAGSVVEAIILHAIQRRPPEAQADAMRRAEIRQALPDLTLGGLLKVADKLPCLDDGTLRAAELAKDFRNLIHPGKEQRNGTSCTRGTAQLALAAMNLAITDATRRFTTAA